MTYAKCLDIEYIPGDGQYLTNVPDHVQNGKQPDGFYLQRYNFNTARKVKYAKLFLVVRYNGRIRRMYVDRFFRQYHPAFYQA